MFIVYCITAMRNRIKSLDNSYFYIQLEDDFSPKWSAEENDWAPLC